MDDPVIVDIMVYEDIFDQELMVVRNDEDGVGCGGGCGVMIMVVHDCDYDYEEEGDNEDDSFYCYYQH